MAPWKLGQSGSTKRRKLGQRDRKTVIMEALQRIAEKRKVTPEEIEEALQVAGLDKALKDSFFHLKEISDGLYGKITGKSDFKSGRATLSDLIW